MKNEERMLELMAETLQRIDRHSELIERQQKQSDAQREQMHTLITIIQQHQQRLDTHEESINTLRERTEYMHQSSLEQVKAYQAITELVMHHNRALAAQGIL